MADTSSYFTILESALAQVQDVQELNGIVFLHKRPTWEALRRDGYPAYITSAGWLGYPEAEVREHWTGPAALQAGLKPLLEHAELLPEAPPPCESLRQAGEARAQRLAEHLAQQKNCALRSDARLMEMHFGSWEGRAWDDIARSRESFVAWMTQHVLSPGSGSVAGFPLQNFTPTVLATCCTLVYGLRN